MDWSAQILTAAFACAGLLCLLVIPIGLPGTWIMLALAWLLELGDATLLSRAEHETFGWGLLAWCALGALLGEVIELVAGALGTRLGGGGHRGMWGAVVGGVVGAIVFTGLVPIPLLGTLLGALIGTFLGAWLGEASEAGARTPRENLRAALGATVGRLAGTLGKTIIGTVVWVALMRAALTHAAGAA